MQGLKSIFFGVVCFIAATGIYFYLQSIENSGTSTRVHWMLALLYNWGGKPAAAGFFVLVGVVSLIVGVYQLMQARRRPAQS